MSSRVNKWSRNISELAVFSIFFHKTDVRERTRSRKSTDSAEARVTSSGPKRRNASNTAKFTSFGGARFRTNGPTISTISRCRSALTYAARSKIPIASRVTKYPENIFEQHCRDLSRMPEKSQIETRYVTTPRHGTGHYD